MTNIPLISVIVPIYNMEKLMRKCLDSILAQTFLEYECLLIDDGSTDGSPAICDEYAVRDCRFKAFHKSNGGLSDARNYGLLRANGVYTIFMDPDDWVDRNCLMEMFWNAKNTGADMVICDYYSNNKKVQTYGKQEPTSLDSNSVLHDIALGNLYGFTWNKLIRNEVYKRYQILYPINMYGCEDQYTMCKILKNPLVISYLPKAYYHYVYNQSGLSRKYDESTYKMDLMIRDAFAELFDGTDVFQDVYDAKTCSMILRAFKYGNCFFSSKKFKEQFIKYKPIVFKKEKSYMKVFLFFSFLGYYSISYKVFSYMFKMKQMFKGTF